MTKYNLPDWVEKYKEKGKSIKVRKGKYYLYQVETIYDKNKIHNHFVKNIYLGSITKENGLIQKKKKNNMNPEDLYSKIYGSYLLFEKLKGNILERLIKHFGEEYGKYIYVISILRAIENTPYCELDDSFQENYYSDVYKNLSMSKSSLSNFLKELSKYKTNMVEFMKEDIENDDILIFDGTNILCGGNRISYTGYGYLHGHNYSSQINELYAYSVKNRKPIYYKLLEGSVSDKTTLKDVLKESGIKNSISLIDKGFNSESNIVSLLENKNQFIMAMRSDSKLVTTEILEDSNRKQAKEIWLFFKLVDFKI